MNVPLFTHSMAYRCIHSGRFVVYRMKQRKCLSSFATAWWESITVLQNTCMWLSWRGALETSWKRCNWLPRLFSNMAAVCVSETGAVDPTVVWDGTKLFWQQQQTLACSLPVRTKLLMFFVICPFLLWVFNLALQLISFFIDSSMPLKRSSILCVVNAIAASHVNIRLV